VGLSAKRPATSAAELAARGGRWDLEVDRLVAIAENLFTQSRRVLLTVPRMRRDLQLRAFLSFSLRSAGNSRVGS
jgi:hypothetical protein